MSSSYPPQSMSAPLAQIWRGVIICLPLCAFLSLTFSVDLSEGKPPIKRSEEMEFDARVVQGQRTEGAVYLFQRTQRPLPPLLKFQRDYLQAIVTPVFGYQTRLGQTSMERGVNAQKRAKKSEPQQEKREEIAQPQDDKKNKTRLKSKRRRGKSKSRSKRRSRRIKSKKGK